MADDRRSGAVSEQWRRLHEALADAAEAIFADARVDSPLLRAEATRYVMRLAQFAREAEVEIHDTDYPMLVKLESPYLQWGLPNPDYLYWYAHLTGGHDHAPFIARHRAALIRHVAQLFESDRPALALAS